ncbi:MAG: bifunctional oligoribonuclease/PAP phosphatase NrnA, partial [Bacteroidales bacterium]|nr:bifunctional oligoribonuclease/PAP phosphatase NrnA [Bacteroidales bacterium]
FDAVADLIELGIDVRGLNQFIYSNLPEHRLRLKGFALLERMVVLPEKKTAYIYLTRDDLQKYHFTSGDTEGLVNYPLSIAGIEFSALFSEPDKAGEVRMSFRSKANFDVNDFAKQLFGGGGHKNASGASAELPLEQVIKMFKLSLINIKI